MSERRPPRPRMVKDQPTELMRFSNLLQQQMRAKALTPADIANQTWLREETIRSYIRAQSRPTRESLSLLRLVLGDEIVAPFADTDLVPPVERNYWLISLNAKRVVLRVLAPMTPEAAAAVIKTLNENGVHELRPYSPTPSSSRSVR